jgi:membrane-associated phospholipid phosphatase
MEIITSSKTTFALPLFITEKNKVVVGIGAFIIGAIIYLASNHFLLFTPHYLPLTPVDNAIPFIPATVWIYITEYFLFAVAYLMCHDLLNLNKYLYSMMTMQIVSIIIFMLYPTIYPRAQFPLPQDTHSLTIQLFNHFRMVDKPTNCFPSLHISSCYLSAFNFLDEQRKKFWFFFLWATVIGISTLTTKQHYLIDVVAGLLMAYIFYWLFHRIIPYKK